MTEEIVKDKHPFCPQCGKKRGVILRKEEWESVAKTKHENYFICCKNCHLKFNVIYMGVWDESLKYEE